MPKRDLDQPPADLPLAEAFVQLMQPSAELVEEAKRKAAARDLAYGRTPPPGGEEAASLLEGFRRLMANDGARTTGRAGSLLSSKRELSPELWPHIEIRGDGTLEVPGAPPIRLYDVVVRMRKPRGAPGYKETDMPLVFKMREMILADPELTPMAAAWSAKYQAAAIGISSAGQSPPAAHPLR